MICEDCVHARICCMEPKPGCEYYLEMKESEDAKVTYRVIVKVGYYEAWFEFESMSEAGAFAQTVLTHQASNEDTTRKLSVRIDVIVNEKGEDVCE